MRSLKLLWMYHDLMDLYGDKGNIQVLKTRAAKRNIQMQVDTCTIGEKRDLTDYDLFFLGGGADREQNLIQQDLMERKDQIQTALNNHTAFLLICGGYQMFGKYYRDQDGNEVPGLGFFDYYTIASDRSHRCIGNIAIRAKIDEETFTMVGFENHGGQTQNVATPLGTVLSGHGNVYKGTYEGFVNEDVIGTYMHGPLLPKNPRCADAVLKRALRHAKEDETLEPLDDAMEDQARKVMEARLKVSEGSDK